MANVDLVKQGADRLQIGGLTGATAASRYVGATASGAPATGTFAVGDYVVDQTGKFHVCTTAGSPGTWTEVGAGGGGGGTSAWTQFVDEDGTSIANWTSVAGTWAANAGGYIEQTGTGASYFGLRYTAASRGLGGIVAMQAEIRVPSTNPATRAFLAPGWDGTMTGVNAPWGGFQRTTNQAYLQRGDQSTASGDSVTINTGTWYTVLSVFSGSSLSVSIDGTIRMVRSLAVGDLEGFDYVGLTGYAGVAHYRNIKAWRLTAPT